MGKPSVVEAARTGLESSQVSSTLSEYLSLQNQVTREEADAHKSSGTAMVNRYYDLVTDFYEYGWGQSFHFAPRHRVESFQESLIRHEHRLALKLGLQPEMKVLDVGCGVGGPMRNIAWLVDVQITGVNINDYQIQRGRKHNKKARLDHRLDFLLADFSKLPLDDESYDAAYAIESTCHALDRVPVFAEVLRVLKPGGSFVGYEWCLTDRYEPDNEEHRVLKQQIEEGDALPSLSYPHEIDLALGKAGFESVEGVDLTSASDPETPWYLPISGKELTLRGLPRTKLGRVISHNVIRSLEPVQLVPKGATELSQLLNKTADALVKAGELGIFTPMYFFSARKPGKP